MVDQVSACDVRLVGGGGSVSIDVDVYSPSLFFYFLSFTTLI